MYKKIEILPTPIEKFKLPFQGQLAEDNRWVIMANLIPWSEFEDEYAKQFTMEMGAPAKSFRIAIGSLIIKERLGLSDRETVEQIRENPYLQYFIGLNSYSNKAPFEASMLVHFRQRIDIELVNKMNRSMVNNNQDKISEEETEKKLLALKRGKKK
ncbi:transposase (plasmid) [Anabaena cylindrica PCC 7122]|nr:transposase [Anabaena cylindrica PCC 7122]BAY06744.1 transposase [Anabaena cylindrica PCC 7122]